MDSLLRHAHMTETSTRVLRYLDRLLTLAGKPYARSKDEALTRVTDFNNGIGLRHWINNNSVKVYNEQNVLRVETTINNPGNFIQRGIPFSSFPRKREPKAMPNWIPAFAGMTQWPMIKPTPTYR